MLKRPEVNTENALRLADFIEARPTNWWWHDCATCYVGQCATMLGKSVRTLDLRDEILSGYREHSTADYVAAQEEDAQMVADFLGIGTEVAHTLCWRLDRPDNSYVPPADASEAAALLRTLAYTGRLPDA